MDTWAQSAHLLGHLLHLWQDGGLGSGKVPPKRLKEAALPAQDIVQTLSTALPYAGVKPMLVQELTCDSVEHVVLHKSVRPQHEPYGLQSQDLSVCSKP